MDARPRLGRHCWNCVRPERPVMSAPSCPVPGHRGARSPVAPDLNIPAVGEAVPWKSALRAEVPVYITEQLRALAYSHHCTVVSLLLRLMADHRDEDGWPAFHVRPEDLVADRRKVEGPDSVAAREPGRPAPGHARARGQITLHLDIPASGEPVPWTSALRADVPVYITEQLRALAYAQRRTLVSLLLRLMADHRDDNGRPVFHVRPEDLVADRRKPRR